MLLYVLFLVLLLGWSVHGGEDHDIEDSRSSKGHGRYYQGMKLYSLENALQEKKALKVLTDSIAALSSGEQLPGKHPFEDLLPAILMDSHLVPPRDKFIVAQNAIRLLGKNYVVYGAGIADNPSFENYMNFELGADVYAFDCTVNPNKRNWGGLKFYPWCIGNAKNLKLSQYARDVAGQQLSFFGLAELRQRLNHTRIDMLKIDIEGCEWDLLYDEVINGKDEDLPTQLLFELHTEGANWRWVPEAIVEGKRRLQVDQLILDLFHKGYRVFHVEINDGDRYCAEIGLYRV